MAKKDDHDLPELPDFDDMDFGMGGFDDFGGSDSKKKKGDRSPFTAAKDSFGKATKAHLADRGFIRRVLSGIIPKGYTQALNTYDAIDRGVAQILKDNKSELDPYLRKLKASTARSNSALMAFLPKSARDAIADSDSSSSYGGQQQDALSANLDEMAKIFKAQSMERVQDQYQDAARDLRDQKRFELDMQVQTSIGRNIGRLVGYQDNILINYHRKHLEISYRQLDVNVKMFQLQREHFIKSQSVLDKILDNTALPDFAKMTHGEVVKQQLANRLSNAAVNTVGKFTSNYFKGVQDNLSEGLGAALSIFDTINSVDMPGVSKSQMAGSMAGQFAGQAAGAGIEQLLTLLADRFGGVFQNAKGVKKSDNFLRRMLTSIPQRLNEYAKEPGKRTGWLGWGEELLKSVLDTYSPTSSINGTGAIGLDKPAYMDQLFYKSVTEIMPGFLASMDRKLGVLVTGEDQEENAYSHYTGGFVKRSTLNQQHVKNALLEGGGAQLRGQVDALLREMGASNLSVEAKRALRRRLMHDMSNAHAFKPERYVKIDTWRDIDEGTANELIEFFADTFGLTISGERVNKNPDVESKTHDLVDRYNGIQSRLPELGHRVNELSGVVGRRAWRELGLTRYNGANGDVIDLNKLADLVINAGDDFNPTADKVKPKGISVEEWRKHLVEQKQALEEKNRKIREGATNEGIDVLNGPINRNLGRSIVGKGTGGAAPTSVVADIKWPEVLNVRDEQAHNRLEAIIGHTGHANQMLELIAQLIPMMGSGGGGSGGGGSDQADGGAAQDTQDAIQDQIDEIRRRWYDASIREGAGGAAKKLFGGARLLGKGFGKYMKFSAGLIFGGTSLGMKAAINTAKFPFKKLTGFGVSDIHRAGEEDPVLTAQDIRRGYYFDVNSKKVIVKLADITGPVKDLRTDEVVLTQDDIDRGLFSGTGESLAGYFSKVGMKAGGLLAKGTKAYISGTYGTMWKVAKFAGNLVLDQFTQFDAYLPGDTEPRIRSVLMKKGKYRNADGSPIMSLKDIDGPVYEMDEDGNRTEIVSQKEIDQYKSFYTVNGSLLYTVAGKVMHGTGRALSLTGQAAGWYAKKAAGFYQGIWKMAATAGRGIKNFIMGRFKNGAVGMLDDEMAIAAVEIGGQQLQTQLQILAFMKSRWDKENVHGDVDGDGTRDWSWQDILRRRKEKVAAAGAVAGAGGSEEVVDAIREMNKNLDEKLDDLIDTTEEAGESSMLEDAADLSDIAGHRKGRGGRRAGRGGPKGKGLGSKLARGAGKLWNGVKKIPGLGLLASGASWLGRGALGVGVAAAPYIAEAATVIGGAISAPVVVGAVVVGGIAYGGYKWYKSEEAKKYPLLYLRLTQYGVDPTDSKRVEQIIQFEGMVRRGITVSQSGSVDLDPSKIPIASVADIFDAQGPERQQALAQWIATRFKPVFLAHCTAMKSIRGTTDLSSGDQGIGEGDYEAYLQFADIKGMQRVYDNLEASPFDGKLTEDSGDVDSAIKMIRDRRRVIKDQKEAAVAAAVATGATQELDKVSTVKVSANGSSSAADISKGLMIKESVKAGRLPITVAGVAAAMNTSTNLDIPTAVRYTTYGLKELKLDKCMQLQKLEEIYFPAITYNGTAAATISGDMDALEQRAIDLFKPAGLPERADVVRWLRFRFIPTLLQYCISIRRRYNGDVKDASRSLTGVAMGEVLDETTRAFTDTMTGQISVWSVRNSPWPGEELETMAGATKVYIDALDKGNSSMVLDVKGMEAQNRADKGDYGKSLVNTALGNQRANASGTGVGQQGPTLANMAKIFGQGKVAGGAAGQSIGHGDGSMLMGGPSGTKVNHPGGGSGGDINSIPDNQGKGMAAMGPIITAAAKMVGFDPETAINVAAVESRLNPAASSGIAHGLFQFVSGTWSDMMTKYGPTYGIAPNTPPTDARANAILGVCYLKENYAGLSDVLGGNVSDVDLYTAHFLGLGGAKRFLTAPRNESAAGYVSAKAIENNASVFTSNGRMRTVGETLQEINRRIQDARGFVSKNSDGVKAAVGADGLPSFKGGDEDAGSEGSGPAGTSAGAAVSALDAANAANGGAAGTPSATQVTAKPPAPMMTQEISDEVTGGMGPAVADNGGSAAPVGVLPMSQPTVSAAPSASRAVAKQTAKDVSDQQAASADGVNGLLQKQLTAMQSMDTNIAGIKDMLQTIMAKGNMSGAQPSARPTASPEPQRRNPLNTARLNAQT